MSLQIRGKVLDRTTGTGLSEVLVSNGEHVVPTRADGTYALEVDPNIHLFIWVSQPTGFRSDGPFYRETPTEEGELDFELVPATSRAARRFCLAQITDTHVTVGDLRTPSEVWSQSLAAVVTQAQPAFVLHSGDLTNIGSVAELALYRQGLAAVDTPVFSLFGNHDGGELFRAFLGQARTSTGNFSQVMGPAYYSFDWGEIHFALYADMGAFFSEGDQMRKAAWLQADLGLQKDSRPSIVVMHAPPTADFVGQMNALGVKAILYGHHHANKAYTYNGTAVLGTAPLCFGGIDTAPRCYRVLEVDGTTIQLDLRPLQAPELQPKTPQSIPFEGREWSLQWIHQVPGDLHRAAPTRWKDRLLLSLRDENLSGGPGVRCLDAASGALLWDFAADTAVKNSVAVDAAGHCAALSVAGTLYLLDAASGQCRWQRQLPHYTQRWIYTSPVIADDVVYAGAKMGYGAFALETGDLRWYTPLEAIDLHVCYAAPQVAGDLLIILVPRRGLLALGRESGEIAWEWQGQVNWGWGRPALAGQTLISGGDPNQLVALGALSGDLIWQQNVPDTPYPTGLVVAGERIFLGTPVGDIRCHDLHSGREHWRFSTGRDLLDASPYSCGANSVLAPPMVWRGKVLAGGNDGVFYMLNAETGSCLGQASFGAPITAAPCLLDDGFCVPTWDGRLCCYRENSR